jgi:hypothetical protein
MKTRELGMVTTGLRTAKVYRPLLAPTADSRRLEIGPRRRAPFNYLRDGNRCVSPASNCISKTVSSAAVLA